MPEILGVTFDDRVKSMARKVFDYQMESDEYLSSRLSHIAKTRMYDDIIINMDFLETAVELEDSKVFSSYASWCFTMLVHRMTYLSKEQVAKNLSMHFKAIEIFSHEFYHGDRLKKAKDYLNIASNQVLKDYEKGYLYGERKATPYEEEVSEFLSHMTMEDTNGAISCLKKMEKIGISIPDIYTEVVAEAMHRVGDLWLINRITLIQELCYTSICQMALSQLYDKIFATPRNSSKIVIACPGQEHHEMGATAVSDVLSYGGYDTSFLGAAATDENILKALEGHAPKMLCLSATMPQTLKACKRLIPKVRETHPDVKIGVGGRAFGLTSEIWRSWDIDVYTKNASELLRWANENIK